MDTARPWAPTMAVNLSAVQITRGNIVTTVKSILADVNPPPDRLERAVSFSSFEQLRSQEDETGFVERSQNARFFRSGQIGQWRQDLSEEQVRRVVSQHREQMERFGYLPEGC